MGKGIQIIVRPEAPIIPILLRYKKLAIEPFTIHGEELRAISIKDGEEAGLVWIKFPGIERYIKAFNPEDVFAVFALSEKEILQKNYYLCEKCWKLTGKIIKQVSSYKYSGRTDTSMECGECGNKWEVII